MSLDKQLAFDTAARQIWTQGGPSVKELPPYPAGNRRVGCCYRSSSGRKCAVGALLPDAAYREEFESHKPSADNITGAALRQALGGLTPVEGRWLDVLQYDLHDKVEMDTKHDEAEFMLLWPKAARKFAKWNGLSPVVLDQLGVPE